MGYWQLGPLFPAWLQTQKDQMDLDISRVSIKDDILSWFWSLNLDYINLADNRIYGTVPSLPTAYQICLCSNKFTSPLPRISSKTFSLNLSHNSFNGSLSPILCQQNNEENILWSLDLSGNILSGELPDCWASWTLLMVLRSQNNILTGHLPSSMGSLLQLRSLHLHNNSLSDRIPSGTQIQGFNASCFIGNLELCGPPLRETCIGDDLPEVPIPGSADEENDDD
uniref:Uncharacterized protein n=1 Tax=Vitis vinifera TaxID=29760 RepID=A5ASK3_VITVI|nr:hypothetical protein VITISV_019540 [Vitis vinifera]